MRRGAPIVAASLALLLGAAVAARAQAPFVDSSVDQDAILEAMSERYPLRIRQVGTTSVTLRIDFPGSISAAYKPRTETHPQGWSAEIAAYRIARALSMDNVPPVISRRIPRPVMENRFEGEDPADWDGIREEIRWDAPGIVRGAMIYWIPRMRRSELDSTEGVDAVAGWLRAGEPLPEDGRARDLAVMLAFDYLIGNWDRFSGGNVSQTDDADRLFVRDHNVAFHAPLYDARYDRVRESLERVGRLPRGFVDRLRALDEDALRAALGQDPEHERRPLLSEAQVAGVMARRRALLSFVAAQIALRGADAVLAWD